MERNELSIDQRLVLNRFEFSSYSTVEKCVVMFNNSKLHNEAVVAKLFHISANSVLILIVRFTVHLREWGSPIEV